MQRDYSMKFVPSTRYKFLRFEVLKMHFKKV